MRLSDTTRESHTLFTFCKIDSLGSGGAGGASAPPNVSFVKNVEKISKNLGKDFGLFTATILIKLYFFAIEGKK